MQTGSTSNWAQRTQAFSDAILDIEQRPPKGVGKYDADAPKRFGVYRNNVIVSLMEALKSAFPSIFALLGDETFSRLARAFVARFPPTSPMMQRYGDQFPKFLEGIPALRELPFMADVARLELLWLRAYHAADANPLTPEDMAQISPEAAMALSLKAHPATVLLRSDYAIADLFDARSAWPTGQTDFSEPQAVLVCRAGFQVQIMNLDAAHAEFFDAMLKGDTLAEALGSAMELDETFDAGAAIGLLISSSAFQSLN
jgi:hypothetical protein